MDMRETSIGQSHEVQGPQGVLYVEESGVGGIPIIFAHSFGGNIAQWDHQIEHFHHNRRVVAFDFRSHGQSDAGTDFFPDALAGDIGAVADRLGMSRFVLVGHSMGGAASVAYAGAHPDRLTGLVLVGTPGKTSAEQSKPVIDSLQTEAYEQVMQGYMKQLLLHAKPDVSTRVMTEFQKLDKATSLRIITALFQFDPLPLLREFSGPVLIISTSREKEQPNALLHQVKDVPGKVIEGTSHWIQMDKPDEFNAALEAFLTTIRI
jgi:pimeloyl-ACP methyl ester carboxylesterase